MAGLPLLPAIHFSPGYRTGEEDPVVFFYRPALGSSTSYRRAVGYFRSSVYSIVGPDTIAFAKRGGHIRLICSPSLTPEDIRSIELGYRDKSALVEQTLLGEIDQLLAQPVTRLRTQILATLIRVGCLDIRIALRASTAGEYHEKLGLFSDRDGNRVSFVGSTNETWSGWHYLGNHEAFEVFCDWRGDFDRQRIDRHDHYFERLWSANVPGVDVMPFPEVPKQRLIAEAQPDLERLAELDADCPVGRIPLPHQNLALRNWIAAGKRGILEHATGSGKTFTALLAIKAHVDAGLPALVLVPSRLLLEQWASEIKVEIENAVILPCGAGNERWKQRSRLAAMTDATPAELPRIVLSTMQTAAALAFRSALVQGPHLMLVADEVHQIGSKYLSNALGIDSGPRLGLSATPTRYGDPDGTNKLLTYFGEVLQPKVTLIDAINAGRLVEYEYFPQVLTLTEEESADWKDLSQKIRLEVARHSDPKASSPTLTQRAKLLLIQRAQIAKKATNKIPLATSILLERYKPGARWLVYCEDTYQLNQLMQAAQEAALSPIEYHSSMAGDKSAALDWFKKFGGVLISIRCLDEGVDIPSITHALILASSQNPRQFIQRRGRVLRKAPNKSGATIYDCLVAPLSLEDDPDQLSLLRSELARALEFAAFAVNRSGAADLRALALRLGIDIAEAMKLGAEEDEPWE